MSWVMQKFDQWYSLLWKTLILSHQSRQRTENTRKLMELLRYRSVVRWRLKVSLWNPEQNFAIALMTFLSWTVENTEKWNWCLENILNWKPGNVILSVQRQGFKTFTRIPIRTLETDILLLLFCICTLSVESSHWYTCLIMLAKKYLEKTAFHLLPLLWIHTKSGYESLFIDRRNLFVHSFYWSVCWNGSSWLMIYRREHW